MVGKMDDEAGGMKRESIKGNPFDEPRIGISMGDSNVEHSVPFAACFHQLLERDFTRRGFDCPLEFPPSVLEFGRTARIRERRGVEQGSVRAMQDVRQGNGRRRASQ